jgi:2-(1,2-epoxy-1,2-dihydrophenyl)acetyl-CoA isomerase
LKIDEEKMNRLVLIEVKNDVGLITLNRPEALNAINIALAIELQAAIDRLTHDTSVRAVLIKGSGNHFCAGGDVKWFAELGERLSQGLDEILSILNPLLCKLINLPIPVVTAVHGMAAGAGVGLALAGDLIIASESFNLLSSYAGIGLSPDLGAAYSLLRRVGLSRAKEFFFRNRPIDAAQCLDWGIVNAVYPDNRLMQEAEKLAMELATAPTKALGLTKRLLDRALTRGVEEQLALEREFMARCGRSHDGKEGVRAFLKKRKPHFTGSLT